MGSESMVSSVIRPVGDGVCLAVSTNVLVPTPLHETFFRFFRVGEVAFFAHPCSVSNLVSV